MKINLLDIISDYKSDFELKEADRNEIYHEIVLNSLRRMRIIAWAVLLLEPVLIVMIDIPRIEDAMSGSLVLTNVFDDTAWIYWAYILCHLILVSASIPIVILTSKLKDKSGSFLTRLNYATAIILPILGLSIFGFLDMLDRITTGQSTVYIVYSLIMCSVYIMKPPINILVLGIPHIVYVLLNFIFIRDTAVIVGNLFNSTAMVFTMVAFNVFLYYNFENHLKKNYALNRKNEKLEFLASHDLLTGLLNRAAFQSSLTQYKSGTIVLIDLDFFKQINDTYSHLAGDSVLMEFSRLIDREFPDAQKARWGGEEFILFCPGEEKVIDRETVEQFRIRLMQQEFVYQEHIFHITASFGITSLTDDYEAAFVRADLALYKAKEEGRNRVICNF